MAAPIFAPTLPSLNHSTGLPTHAIYDFTNLLIKCRPEYVAVVLDAAYETFRNQMFAGYKSNRPAPPADLIPQFSYFRRVLEGLDIALLEVAGYEADAVIATLCHTIAGNGCDLMVVSSDKDFMQLVTDGIKLLDGAKDRWIGAAEVNEKFGVEPAKVMEVMELMGDAVDNIPGVKRIGEKPVIGLIRRFGTLENLFSRLDNIEHLERRRAAAKNAGGWQRSGISQPGSGNARRNAPINISLEPLKFTGFDEGNCTACSSNWNSPT